jgi:hypothetical protein
MSYLVAVTLMVFFNVLPFGGFIDTEITQVPLPTILTVLPDTVQIRFSLEETVIEILPPLTDLIPAVFKATDDEIFLPTDEVKVNFATAVTGVDGVETRGLFVGTLLFEEGTVTGLLDDPVGVTATRDEYKDPPGC